MTKEQVICSSCNKRIGDKDVLCPTCILDLLNESAEPEEIITLPESRQH